MTGSDLLRDARSLHWPQSGSMLLLNPGMPPAWRRSVLEGEFPDLSGHVWLATSGSGGMLKLVALSSDALEASARAVNAHLASDAADVWLNALPLFHAGGLGIIVRAALAGSSWEPCGAWSADHFTRRAYDTGATLASLVPTQVRDLESAGAPAPPRLRAVVVGGGPLEESTLSSMRRRGWNLLPSYGLTEAASQVATARVDTTDFAWLPLLPHCEARLGEGGVLELRGNSLMDGWMLFRPDGSAKWEDPKRDGWLRTGDRAELRRGEIRLLGRADDLVKIRGELVDLSALEISLQSQVPSGRVAVHRVPDERSGFELLVVAENAAAAAEARAVCGTIFPHYARPREITAGVVEKTALGKTVRRRGA
jgi:O-succinylbenzoic acid--CoA ligase